MKDDPLILIGLIVTALIAPTWLAWWNARVARKQLQPNGGTSIADKVTRIEARVDNHSEKFDHIDSKLDHHDSKLDRLEVKIDGHLNYMDSVHNRRKEPRDE